MISLIFNENPISRAYIALFRSLNIRFDEIIILNEKTYFPNKLKARIRFKDFNYWAIKFLKKKEFVDEAKKIEKYFHLNDNFLDFFYNFEEIFNCAEKITFLPTKSINSKICEDYLNGSNLNTYLISHHEIVKKNILSINKSLIHIHPAYLPNIQGADGSLWSIYNENIMGVSSLYINENIDDGKIISREKINFPKLKLKSISKDIKYLYRFWFCFVDPMLRAFHLKNIIHNNFKIENIRNKDKGKYFTFMTEKDLIKTFEKILL